MAEGEEGLLIDRVIPVATFLSSETRDAQQGWTNQR